MKAKILTLLDKKIRIQTVCVDDQESMEIKFDGKRALVTGAGKGIGRGVTIKLAECGADVVAVSRTQSDLDELSKISPKIQTLLLDVGDWELTKTAIENVGPIDLLVNNAGISGGQLLGDISEEEVDTKFDINVKAIINITQIVAIGMKARGKGGSIVNVSSIGGIRGAPSRSIYCASKGAVDQLTRSMAVEFGPYNIRVNSVNPTAIRTQLAAWLFAPDCERGKEMQERTPLKRLGEVNEVVYPILFLLSDKASLITGTVMPIDGGLTVCF